MADQANEPLLKLPANTAADASVTNAGDLTKLPSVEEKTSAARRLDPETFPAPATAATSTNVPEFRAQNIVQFQTADRATRFAPAEMHAATHLIGHTMELTEQMRVNGSDEAEVQMRLPDGNEIVVSLHLANGEWKVVFRAETDSLCQALEHSWRQNAAQPSDHSVRFSAPAFESAQSQGGFGENGGRHSDPQDRNLVWLEQAGAFPTLPSRNGATAMMEDAARPTAGGEMRLYA